MISSHDAQAAAREQVDIMVSDLTGVTSALEEVATMWRRAQLYPPRAAASSPSNLQQAAGRLAGLLRVVPDTGTGEQQALVSSAARQLAALADNVADAARMAGDRHVGDAEMWEGIRGRLLRVREQLQSLMADLTGPPRTAFREDPAAR
jgi:hypothetical protein